MSVGVIVGRFQVDEPHAGHRDLIEAVLKRHGKVLVCLGIAHVKLSKQDPLDFATRARMFQQLFPTITVAPIQDMPDDALWSKQLDAAIAMMFPTDDAVMYGSRDSFFPHYQGVHPKKEIDTVSVLSGTLLRQRIADTTRDSKDFRAGVIYACHNKFPISYQVVDVAIVRGEDVLLAQKWHESMPCRFIGGFVSPSDESLELAARREVREEVGVEVGAMKYLGSFRIDDWRFRGREDRILSAFFMADYIFGAPKAADDIVDVGWVPIAGLLPALIKEHLPLGHALVKHTQGGRD